MELLCLIGINAVKDKERIIKGGYADINKGNKSNEIMYTLKANVK